MVNDLIPTFFLIVAPGLEDLALAELQEKWALLQNLGPGVFEDLPAVEKTKGGLTLQTSYQCGWLLNCYLRIPTRIVMRLAEFKAKDFPPLFNKLKWIPWPDFLRDGDVDVKVSTAKSRLRIKTKIAKVTQDALADAKLHQGWRKTFLNTPQTVLLRIENDIVTVSLDTSGDALYLRGYKPYSVDAPVRETLAAALYYAAHGQLGHSPQSVLDPMCGSGTLLFESHFFWQSNRFRKFSYENFPFAPKNLTFDYTRHLPMDFIAQSEGWDISSHAIEAAEKNREIFKKALRGELLFRVVDSFKFESTPASKPDLILINPPYNERLKTELQSLNQNFSHLFRQMDPQVMAFFWPASAPCEMPSGAQECFSIRTLNGGLPVLLKGWSRR